MSQTSACRQWLGGFVLAAAMLTIACASSHHMVETPQAPSCRAAIAAPTGETVPIEWWVPEREDDRRDNDEWCRTVGPAVIAGPQPGREVATGHRLLIATWNTFVGGGDLESAIRDVRAGLWTYGEPVGDFVLLLQEVHRDGPAVPSPPGGPFPGAIIPSRPRARIGVVDAAGQLGLHVFYAPSMRNGEPCESCPREDRGNAIVSSVRLSEFQAIELPFERQRRVAVSATVQVATPRGEDIALRVASAHLDNLGQPGRLLAFAAAGRTRQMRGLLDALPSEGPSVLGADLNTWFGTREGAFEHGLRAYPDTPLAEVTTMRRVFRLDYLFFRLPEGATARWRVLRNTYGSDHYPVVGEITW